MIYLIPYLLLGWFNIIYDRKTEEILLKRHGLIRLFRNNFIDDLVNTLLSPICFLVVIKSRKDAERRH